MKRKYLYNILLFTFRHIFWITYLRCISTSFFSESGNPLFKKFCRASTVAASTFDFRAALDCTNSGASFTTSENIQQHINCNLVRRKRKKLLDHICGHSHKVWQVTQPDPNIQSEFQATPYGMVTDNPTSPKYWNTMKNIKFELR